MRRCCAPLGVLLAASTTQSLSFTAQSRLSRVHPARRTAPPTLGAIALLAEQLEVVRSIRPADDSAEVQFKLWENAGLNPTYKVSGSISGEPSYTRLFSHADWRAFCNDRKKVEMRGFIDGDLIEAFAELPPAQKAEVAAEVGDGVDELTKLVEELTRLH